MAHRMPDNYAIPVLASLDYGETKAFYGSLGFNTGYDEPHYLIMVRDGIELHFWACDERRIAEATSCYIQLADVGSWYQEFSALDLGRGRIGELADQPWGMREFAMWDPHGNLLRIGQAIGGA